MLDRCEVCQNFRPGGDARPNRKLLDVSFGKRNVRLCVGHARIAENSGIKSLDGLRELYGESEGKRSFVPRRGRSVVGPSGERRNIGRRKSDR
jgi:hypothetical protein